MELRHGRIALALRRVREGEGTPMLLLHALHGSSADWGSGPAGWPGPVCALDFAGHGRSGWGRGGGSGCGRWALAGLCYAEPDLAQGRSQP